MRVPFRLLAAAWLALASAPAWAQEEGREIQAEEEVAPRMSAAEARRVIAEPPPPVGTKPQEEIEYWSRHERAAFVVGRADLRIAALRRLVALTDEKTKLSPWESYLWREMWRGGQQTEALALGERLAEDKRALPAQRLAYTAQLGVDYANLGDVGKARAALVKLEAEAPKVKEPGFFLRIMLEHLRGSVRQAEGDYAAAEAANKRGLALSQQEVAATRAKASQPGGSVDYDRAVRVRFDQMQRSLALALIQGKSEEAEATARLGLAIAAEEGTGGGTVAYWQAHLARSKLGQRRYAEARDAAAKAVELLRESGAGPTSERVINAETYLMQALFGLERWAEADQLNARMWEASASDPVARRRIDSAALQSYLHLRNGRLDQALQRVDVSIKFRTANYGETNPTTIEVRAVRAMVYQAQGNTRAALEDYRAVFRSVFAPETSFTDAEPAGLRGQYIPAALRSYLALAAASPRDAEMAADAFRVADRLRASVVQRALTDSAARAAASTPELAALIRREQDQRSKMRELFGELNRAVEEERKQQEEFRERQKEVKDREAAAKAGLAERERARTAGAAIRKEREALAAAEAERGRVLVELRDRFPEYQALVNPKPAAPAAVAGLLRRDEALVSIFPTVAGTFVWAIPAGGEGTMHYAKIGAADIAQLVARMRSTLDVGEKLEPAPPSFDAAASARLFAEIVAPVWERIAGAKTVIFVVNGDLAQVPLATLVTGEDPATAWIVRRVAVAQVSSVAALQALRQSRPRARAPEAFAGFGDPPTPYAPLPPLPETRREILAIAKALGAKPDRDAIFGARASRETVMRENLANRRVLAFATHGLKPGDLPGLSRPALALAGPEKPVESPLLVLDDVMTLKLNADTVVLSACNTASADGRAEEALSGLARGFFFAGARSVIVTHWAVESLSAEDLVTRTFGHLAGDPSVTRAEALRRAQLEMIDGKSRPAFRHPFFWAPYALSGDPAQ